MAQIILNRKNGSDEVLAVLEDGAFPGTKIIGHTDLWDAAPMGDWWIIHVPGEPASAFANLMEPEREEVEPGEFKQVNRRKNHLNVNALSGIERAELASNKKLTVARNRIQARPRNN